MRIAAFDLGMNCGFGVLGRDYCRSGTYRLGGGSSEMGVTFRSLVGVVNRVVTAHKPQVLTAVEPHIGREANPINLKMIFGLFCRLQEVALDLELPFHAGVIESDARKAFLGKVPRRSKEIKIAVVHGCRIRGWPATDDHAADALCTADFVLAQLDKGSGWNRTPLAANQR